MRGAFLVLGALALVSLTSCAKPPGTIPTVILYDHDVPMYHEHLWALVDQQGHVLLFEPNAELYSIVGDKKDKFAVITEADFHDKTFPGPVILFKGGKQTVFESETGWKMAYANSPTEKDGLSRSAIYLKPLPPKK